MLTPAAVLEMIDEERSEEDRFDVLEPLCDLYIAVLKSTADDFFFDDDVAAHRFYVMHYYGRSTMDPVGDSYTTDNPREVSVPEWAIAEKSLLKHLAKNERRRDDAFMRECQRAGL